MSNSWDRVLTRTGSLVHIADNVTRTEDGSLAGRTHCDRAVTLVLAPYEVTEERGFVSDDHRPVSCSRCLGWLDWQIRILKAVMAGEPTDWWKR